LGAQNIFFVGNCHSITANFILVTFLSVAKNNFILGSLKH